MSLLRLLTAGKSLVGLKKLEHRYHLPAQSPLPQFGPKKNPFRATVVPEKAQPSADAMNLHITAAPAAHTHPPSASKGDTICEPNDKTQPGSFPREPGPTAAAPSPRASGLRAFLLWGRARNGGTRTASKDRPMVQAELSLEAVRVVRNDLSESDLEVVAARGPQSEPSGAAAAGAKIFEPESMVAGMGSLCSGAKT